MSLIEKKYHTRLHLLEKRERHLRLALVTVHDWETRSDKEREDIRAELATIQAERLALIETLDGMKE